MLAELMTRDVFPSYKDEVLVEFIDSVLYNKWIARKEELKQLMDKASKDNSSDYADLAREYSELHSNIMRKKRVRFRTT